MDSGSRGCNGGVGAGVFLRSGLGVDGCRGDRLGGLSLLSDSVAGGVNAVVDTVCHTGAGAQPRADTTRGVVHAVAGFVSQNTAADVIH